MAHNHHRHDKQRPAESRQIASNEKVSHAPLHDKHDLSNPLKHELPKDAKSPYISSIGISLKKKP